MKSRIRTQFSIFLGLLPPITGAQVTETGGYSYIGLPQVGEQFAEILRLDGEFIFDGDVGRSIQICSADADYHCAISSIIELAIPRRLIKTDDVWEYNGRTYTFVTTSVFAPMLSCEKIAVIESQDEFKVTSYFFSPNFGVVGLRIIPKKDPERVRFLLLHGNAGLGADWNVQIDFDD